MIAPKLTKLLIWKTKRQADAANDTGPALEQHCCDVLRRPYSQSRALQCLRVYALEDYVCVCACVVLSDVVCHSSAM